MKRTLVVGDIHGAHKALTQVLERSQFDYENDKLILTGDICDGWPETKQCVDELIKIKNRVFVIGNHDKWFIDWIDTGSMPYLWVNQGGKWSIRSYGHHHYGPWIPPEIPSDHYEFWHSYKPFFVDQKNRLFVHAGVDKKLNCLRDVDYNWLTWHRSFWEERVKRKPIKEFEEVFIGHTTTEEFSLDPVQRHNVWNVDQGAGWGGRLTLMDVDTKDFWSSDIVSTLYDHGGRHKLTLRI